MTEESTLIPNSYIDEYLPELSCAELKVWLVVLRKTLGQPEIDDGISLSQLEKITGLTRHSVINGLKGLIERGLIVQTRAARGIRPASYKCVIPGD